MSGSGLRNPLLSSSVVASVGDPETVEEEKVGVRPREGASCLTDLA